jgi:4-amino-4-deoxy-L-arabinose transferase-like glycosyltransferase
VDSLHKNTPPLWLILLMVLLAIPALFINLGMPAIAADEPTRALVAMEMMFRQDYLVSTIVGEFYYKKPPLFNWILVVIYQLTGSNGELVTRLVAVVPLLLFTWRIFVVAKKYLSHAVALLAAFIHLTYGRMLFYDSLLGHIDILYAWITFETFVLLFDDMNLQKPWRTFILFYVLHGIAFMLKGLPSLLFPPLTLLAWIWYQRQFKPLISIAHVIAILAGLVFPVGFFIAYAQVNSLEGWMMQLWDQSKQRTVLDKTLWESVQHLFTFPIDHLMHFAPWSVLLVFLLNKNNAKLVWQHTFMRFMLMVLVCNIPVYWASPGYYPRYIFMLYPILFMVIAQAYMVSSNIRWFQVFVLILCGLLLLAIPVVVIQMDWKLLYWGTEVSIVILLAAFFLCFVNPRYAVWSMVLVMWASRIFFNAYVIPHRTATGSTEQNKQEAIKVAQLTVGKPLYIAYPGSSSEQYHYYYIERARNEPLHYKALDTTSYFLYLPNTIADVAFETVYAFDMDYENMQVLLVRFTKIPPLIEEMSPQRFYLNR